MLLKLKTLGMLEASTEDADGVVRSLARGKPVAMLAYLTCIPGHKASREHLAALLWGDVESESARQNLRQTLWYLKKKLGEGLIDGTGETLSLAVPVSCDRDEFLQAAQRADFAAAVQRHPGSFIPDFAAPGASEFEQWCELERRRLTVTFLRCADALARQWLGEGRFREAQELARRARDVDPLDQAAWRLLLESLVAGSDGLGATSEAEHLEALLAREEQEPEAATVAAIRMARRSPSAIAKAESSPTAAIAVELVGRETQFSQLLSAWESARGGAPRVMVMSAAAGMGKSRLLRDVRARLRASRSRCLLVRANPGDRHLSGGFVAEVVSQLAALSGSAAVSTGSAGVLVGLAPALASTYASATPDRSEGEEAVRRRALAMVDLVHAVSDEHAVALLLDDLHWADDHSARVIAGALSRLEHARLLAVIARRAASDPRGLFASFERLDLPPLDLASVTAFVSHVCQLPPEPWAEMLPHQLLLATGGSPLLLVETLHDALEQGWMRCDGGTWHCDDSSRIAASLREGSAVRQRVHRLPPRARHALMALSLVGRPIEIGDALAMMGNRAAQIDEPLEVLERGGFIARNGTLLTVTHDEIADAAVDAANEDDQRGVHERIARYMLTRRRDELALRRAAEHASAIRDAVLLTQAWRFFLALRRRARDRRGTRELAADFLASDRSSPNVGLLVRATPYLKRERSRWLTAAGIALLAVSGAAIAMTRRPAPPQTADVAVWTVDSATGAGRLVGVRLDPDAPWEAGAPIEAVELDSTDLPRMPEGAVPMLYRSPDGRSWWGNLKRADLGDEGFVLDSLGRLHLPLRSTGDDGVGSFSPDGRQLAGVTARYDTITDHLQVVRAAPAGGAVRRLTNSPESDRIALWRPDGTQIATQRHYFVANSADRVCLVDIDATHERCLALDAADDMFVTSWLDERRLLVESVSGSLWTFDATNGRMDPVPGVLGHAISTDNSEIRVCNCRLSNDAESSLYLMLASNPSAVRPLLYRGRPLRGAVRYIGGTYPHGEWLASLRLQLPAGGLSVENVHRLSVEGRRANGAPAWLHDLRWTSRDTTVATIDSTGRLRPRKLGSSWIIVSAGGWRVDSALARITPPASQTAFRETWGADWMQRWRPIGTPPGIVVQTSHGPALLPNGDGSYVSGAYAPAAFASSAGAGLEADVSLRVTRTQWQTLTIELRPAEALASLRTWDHRSGPGPITGGPVCGIGIPGVEGVAGLGYLTLGGIRQSVKIRIPKGLYSGGWHRLRLQVLADGRCAMAIDGTPLGIAPSGVTPLSPAVFPFIVGHDRFDGRLVVGPLEAWSGVRGGVDWTRLDDDAAVKKP